MLLKKRVIAATAFTALAACGGGETDMATPPPPGPYVNSAPTLSTSTINGYRNRHASIGRSDISDGYVFDPPGTATYRGGFVADNVTINGDNTGDGGRHGLAGDVTVLVDWSKTNAVSGQISNINRLEGGVSQERLSGNLFVSGVTNKTGPKRISPGELNGSLAGGFGTTERQTVNFSLDFDASTRHPNDTRFLAPPEENLRYIYSDNVNGLGTGGVTVDITDAELYGER